MNLKTCKFSFDFERKISVKFMRFFRCVSESKMNMFPLYAGLSLPFFILFGPRNAFISRSVAFVFASIGLILHTSTWPQIFLCVVESISVLVVCFWIILANNSSQNKSVHEDHFSGWCKPSGIVYVRLTKPICIPIPLHKPFIIFGVNDSVQASCNRNVTNCGIGWLFKNRPEYI